MGITMVDETEFSYMLRVCRVFLPFSNFMYEVMSFELDVTTKDRDRVLTVDSITKMSLCSVA